MDGSSVGKVPSKLFWIFSPQIQAGIHAPVVAGHSEVFNSMECRALRFPHVAASHKCLLGCCAAAF